MRWLEIHLGALVLVGVVVLGACSSADPAVDVGSVRASLDVESYRAAYADYEQLLEAELERCVVESGFEYSARPTPEVVVPTRSITERYGFNQIGSLGDADLLLDLRPAVAPQQSLSGSEAQAYGVVQRDCFEAAESVAAELLPDLSLPPEAEAVRDDLLRRAAELDLEGSYRTCMANSGYQVVSRARFIEEWLRETDEFRTRWVESVLLAVNEGEEPPPVSEVFSQEELDEIEQLRDQEIDRALSDWDCGGPEIQTVEEAALALLDAES